MLKWSVIFFNSLDFSVAFFTNDWSVVWKHHNKPTLLDFLLNDFCFLSQFIIFFGWVSFLSVIERWRSLKLVLSYSQFIYSFPKQFIDEHSSLNCTLHRLYSNDSKTYQNFLLSTQPLTWYLHVDISKAPQSHGLDQSHLPGPTLHHLWVVLSASSTFFPPRISNLPLSLYFCCCPHPIPAIVISFLDNCSGFLTDVVSSF